MRFTIDIASAEDAETLSTLARDTFVETFGHLYPPQDLAHFLEASYAPPKLVAELGSVGQLWLLARDASGAPIGYAQAGPCSLPHLEATEAQGELKRLYLVKRAQGVGLGGELMRRVLEWIWARFEGPIWVGVWSENHRALELYRRFGFEKVGEYEFEVGATRDREFILVHRPMTSDTRRAT